VEYQCTNKTARVFSQLQNLSKGTNSIDLILVAAAAAAAPRRRRFCGGAKSHFGRGGGGGSAAAAPLLRWRCHRRRIFLIL
jgi:hypothetical protein